MTSVFHEQIQRALGDAHLIERELGGGGMSRVFLAHERALGRKVVVKVLLPELAAGVNVERFRREIILAAQLQHPHIVPLLSAGEADGLPYFIMPFVSGESLRTRISREGEFPVPETIRILRDLVSALGYAHSNGVVHRDVKPENVLLSGGVAVVTDFGVAKAVSASAGAGDTGLTSLGVALGTPTYMAPEQATASPHTDHRADIYALGVVAYEMLTGFPPFAGRSPQAVLAAHVVEDPEPLERRRPSVPPMLAALVKGCLAKRPAERPQTAAELMHLLDAITTPSGGTAATTAVRVPAAVERPRRSLLRLLPWAAGLFGILIAAAALWPKRTPAPSIPKGESLTGRAAVPPPTMNPARDSALPDGSAQQEPPKRPLIAPVTGKPRTPGAAKATRRSEPSREILGGQETARSSPPSQPETPIIAQLPIPDLPVADSAPRPAIQRPAPPPAPTPPPPIDNRPAIRAVVGDYAHAIESGSLGQLRRIYPGMTPLQQRGWEQFFQLVREVKAELSIQQLEISGDAAEAQVIGTYVYQNTSTGRQEHQPVSFHASFRNQDGAWRIVQVQ